MFEAILRNNWDYALEISNLRRERSKKPLTVLHWRSENGPSRSLGDQGNSSADFCGCSSAMFSRTLKFRSGTYGLQGAEHVSLSCFNLQVVALGFERPKKCIQPVVERRHQFFSKLTGPPSELKPKRRELQ